MVSSGEFTIVIGCRLGFLVSSAFSSDRSTDSCLLILAISSVTRLYHGTEVIARWHVVVRAGVLIWILCAYLYGVIGLMPMANCK